DNRGIELRLDRLGEPQASYAARHCISVRPIRCHRVIRVRDRDNARNQGYPVAGDTIGIALPVDSLMMMSNDRSDLGVCVNVRQDSLTDFGVALHLPPLVEGERTRLFEQT